jgi:type IX secretion system PorP/SprF family membrane protein
MHHKHVLALLATIAIPFLANAQDSPLSQWFNNSLTTDPSVVGNAGKPRIHLFYRNQWHKADAGFNYYGTEADMPVGKNMGCGILITNDKTAAFSKPTATGAYSYTIKLNQRTTVRGGLSLGVIQKFVNTSDLIFEQDEPAITKSSKISLDAGIGISLVSNGLTASVSVNHLTKPQQGISTESDARTCMKMTFGIGYTYIIKTAKRKNAFEITPNLIFQQHGTQQNLEIGVINHVKGLLTGLSCRKNLQSDPPTVIFLIGYETENKLRIAYSYDVGTNGNTSRYGNAHEISATKLFDIEKKKKHKPIECPSFF